MTTDVGVMGTRVEIAASTVYRRYYRYTTLDDVTQEVWLYLSANRESMATVPAKDFDRRLRNAAERFCRKERAAKVGYDSSDEQFYSIKKLEKLIYDAFDSQATGPQESYRDDEQYAEWMTEVSDVRRALRKSTFPLYHYGILRQYATEGRKLDDTVRASIRVLQRQLGGSRP